MITVNMRLRLFLAAMANLLVAQAATDFGLSSLNASTTCNDTCKELVLRVSSWEKSQRLSDSSFYEVPTNFSTAMEPGTVLTLELTTNLTNYTVPTPLTMSRMMYTTEDLNGTIIPASAYILWPSSPLEVQDSDSSNSTHWPLVAWAHGTSGGLAPCAPSNYRNLQYHFQVPYLLALQGYVVVAPDYAGLGVGKLPNGEDIGHPWAAAPAHANDVANAIVAARNAFPEYLRPSGPFVAMGHSQGAAAVWSFTERLVDKPIPGFKGAIVFAPPTDVINQTRRAINDQEANKTQVWTKTFLSLQPPLAKGITAVYPEFNLSGLTEAGRDRWVNVQEAVQGCLPTKGVSSIGVPLGQLAYRNWTEQPTVLDFEKRIAIGRRPFKGPFLIAAGNRDSVVDFKNLEGNVRETCGILQKAGTRESLEFLEYTGQNHFPVIQASQGKWLGWIRDHIFSTASVSYGCKFGTVQGFKNEEAINSVFPNFLVEVAGPGEGWKYSL